MAVYIEFLEVRDEEESAGMGGGKPPFQKIIQICPYGLAADLNGFGLQDAVEHLNGFANQQAPGAFPDLFYRNFFFEIP